MASSDDHRPHDHRRFLPREVHLSPLEHANVLDRFFRFFASWGLRVIPTHFHTDMMGVIQAPRNSKIARASHYSPFLHNVILAVALGFADDENLRSLATREIFMREADRYLEGEIARPSLATVHALALKPSFYSLQGDHMTGWTTFGLADRAAQSCQRHKLFKCCLLIGSVGLNVDCSDLVRAHRMSEDEMLAVNSARHASRPHGTLMIAAQ